MFSALGSAAGVMREICNAKQSPNPPEEIPMGTLLKGGFSERLRVLPQTLLYLVCQRGAHEERSVSGPARLVDITGAAIGRTRPRTPIPNT